MTLLNLRTISVLALATLLAACGGAPFDEPTQTAATIQTGVATTSVATGGTSTGTGSNSGGGKQVAGEPLAANTPAPDCAADGCRSLRIIDANAEAFRFDAMRRSAETPQS